MDDSVKLKTSLQITGLCQSRSQLDLDSLMYEGIDFLLFSDPGGGDCSLCQFFWSCHDFTTGMSSQGARVFISPSYGPHPKEFFDRKTSGFDLSGSAYLFSQGSPVQTNKELSLLSRDEVLLFNQIQPKADIELVKFWLNNCSQVYESRCRNVFTHPVNMRL
jgi:hypothetical protein